MESDAEILRRAEGTVGKLLRGKWRLDRVLGVGGMAAVYAATHRNGTRAAIKVLHPEAALAPSIKDRFLREGYLANRVEHPGALSIQDDDIDEDGTVFLVMELLSGETLEMRLERHDRSLPYEDLLQVAYQILDCLEAAHARGIVHRDLKPGNLFVTEKGRVKILDFGIARLRLGKSGGHTTGSQALGTPGYMPPEQARGRWEEVDAQSDLWAVGAVLFALVAGRPVHEAHTVNEQLLSAMTKPAESIRFHAPDLPDVLADLIDKALAFSKADRFQDAGEMKAAVAGAYETLTGKPIETATPLTVRPPKRRISVDPGAPTLDAASGPDSPIPQTTARPVAGSLPGQPSEPPTGSHTERPSPSLRRVGLGVAVALLALSGWLMLAAQPAPHSPVSDERSAAAGVAQAPASSAVEEPIAPPERGMEFAEAQASENTSEDAPNAEPEGAEPAASVTTSPPTPSPSPTKAVKRAKRWPAPKAKAPPAPKPPEPQASDDKPSLDDIDLFTRRK